MLVVTIIVLLILAGVTITSVIGNGGLMLKAQGINISVKRIQIVSNIKTEILDAQLDGDITKGELEEILIQYGEVQYDDNGDITGVYVVEIDDIINIDEVFKGTLEEKIIDTTAPTVTIELSSTTTTIGVAVSATVAHVDSESGVDIANCKYIYTTTSETIGTTSSTWDTAESFSTNPQTLSLSSGELGTYYLHVLSIDLTGNCVEVVSEQITVADITAPTVTISLSSTSTKIGTAITATVTHTDNESGVDITNCKYIYNTTSGTIGTTSTSWDSASNFSSNPQSLSLSASALGTYYLHVLTVDLAGNMAEAVSDAVSVKDTTAPTITISLSATSTKTSTAVTAKVTHTDSESGVNITSCKYIYNTTSGTLGTSSSSWNSATSFSSNPQTLTLSASTAGTYYLHVLSVDKSGNKSEKTSSAISVIAMKAGDYVNYTPTTGTYTVVSGTNGSGYTSDQSFTTGSLKWRILSVNSTTGVIELVSATVGPTLYLTGANGYNHAVDILNDLCETLYSKTSSGSQVAVGRSINVEDINAKTTYDYTSYVNDSTGYSYGTVYTPEYKTYPNIYAAELGSTKKGLNDTSDLLTGSEGYKSGTVNSSGVTSYSSSYTGTSTASTLYATYTYYTYATGSYLNTSLGINTASAALLNLGTNYWLASRCVYLPSGNPYFELRYVGTGGGVAAKGLYDSYNGASTYGYAVRPVVTLSSSATFSVDTTNSTSTTTYWNVEF